MGCEDLFAERRRRWRDEGDQLRRSNLEAMREEMRRDNGVFVIGEDIARQGGIFGQFKGLPRSSAGSGCCDTPISEAAIVGAALGAAIAGMRPVVDIMYSDFLTCAMDELVNQSAKMRYMSGGQIGCPGDARPGRHGRARWRRSTPSPWRLVLPRPGLKVVCPLQPGRRQGPAQDGHPRRQPRALLRAQAAVRDQGSGAQRGGGSRGAPGAGPRRAGRADTRRSSPTR